MVSVEEELVSMIDTKYITFRCVSIFPLSTLVSNLLNIINSIGISPITKYDYIFIIFYRWQNVCVVTAFVMTERCQLWKSPLLRRFGHEPRYIRHSACNNRPIFQRFVNTYACILSRGLLAAWSPPTKAHIHSGTLTGRGGHSVCGHR